MDNFDLLGRWREDTEDEDIGELLESEESEEKEDGMQNFHKGLVYYLSIHPLKISRCCFRSHVLRSSLACSKSSFTVWRWGRGLGNVEEQHL